jgi:signal peptidase II
MTDPQNGMPEGLPEPAPVAPEAPPAAAPAPASLPPGPRPTFVFFGAVAAVSLIADVSTKAWAEITLSRRNPLLPSIELVKEHLAFTLAYNPGGAWGLFQRQSEYVRRPFFLLVSLLAIAFIINLYGRLTPQQKALKWGLPLVLGGALGNLSDRIVRSNVIDFIDYQAKWIEQMNRTIAKFVNGWAITDHWPTFNVADIAICVGVGLMAVDMFTSRRMPSAPALPTVSGNAI